MRFVFYPAQSGKPWNGATLYQESLGGSESAVAYMARELAKLGHEVIVFTLGEQGVFDDVIYVDFYRARSILMTLPIDVLVCSRDAMPMLWAHRASIKVFWAHDMPQGKLPDGFDCYLMVSVYQANLYVGHGFAPKEKVQVSPNGVDINLFKPLPTVMADYGPEDTVQLAWTSNPERGLWHAARILQNIRRIYPKAELHVFGRNDVYGWGMEYEHTFHPEPEDMAGVVFHPSMTKSQLAEELASMDLWLYPTWWPETFCIAGLEAQAAGVPVIAPDFGALSETVVGGTILPAQITDPLFDTMCTQAVVDLLSDGERRLAVAQGGRRYAEAMTWARHAKHWDIVFSKAMGL